MVKKFKFKTQHFHLLGMGKVSISVSFFFAKCVLVRGDFTLPILVTTQEAIFQTSTKKTQKTLSYSCALAQT